MSEQEGKKAERRWFSMTSKGILRLGDLRVIFYIVNGMLASMMF